MGIEREKQDLSNEYDAFLLNETASTLKSLGEYKLAVKILRTGTGNRSGGVWGNRTVYQPGI